MNVAELEGEERTHAWETEDGFEVDAGVVVGESGGPLPWFPVKHETPDAFMEPEWIVHPNGALGMMAIHAVAENPKETAKALKAAWGATVEEIFDGCTMVKTGSVELLIWSPLAFQLEYKATRDHGAQATCRRSSASPSPSSGRARCRRLLRANNVPLRPDRRRPRAGRARADRRPDDRVHAAELSGDQASLESAADLNCSGISCGTVAATCRASGPASCR